MTLHMRRTYMCLQRLHKKSGNTTKSHGLLVSRHPLGTGRYIYAWNSRACLLLLLGHELRYVLLQGLQRACISQRSRRRCTAATALVAPSSSTCSRYICSCWW